MNASNAATIVNQVLSAANVSGGRDDSVFEPGAISVRTEIIDDPQRVRSRLRDFAALSGWVQTTSDVKPVAQLADATGHVLCAETAGDGESLHVRQNGEGGWIVATLTTEDGDELLTEKEFSAGERFGALHYQVSWRREETSDGFEQWRPHAARLIHRPKGE